MPKPKKPKPKASQLTSDIITNARSRAFNEVADELLEAAKELWINDNEDEAGILKDWARKFRARAAGKASRDQDKPPEGYEY